MRPALDERPAPDAPSGAVPLPPSDPAAVVPPLRERDFWRAVGAGLLATLRPWPR
jgi:hypothetical protein